MFGPFCVSKRRDFEMTGDGCGRFVSPAAMTRARPSLLTFSVRPASCTGMAVATHVAKHYDASRRLSRSAARRDTRGGCAMVLRKVVTRRVALGMLAAGAGAIGPLGRLAGVAAAGGPQFVYVGTYTP